MTLTDAAPPSRSRQFSPTHTYLPMPTLPHAGVQDPLSPSTGRAKVKPRPWTKSAWMTGVILAWGRMSRNFDINSLFFLIKITTFFALKNTSKWVGKNIENSMKKNIEKCVKK